jgi:hypothetical protein
MTDNLTRTSCCAKVSRLYFAKSLYICSPAVDRTSVRRSTEHFSGDYISYMTPDTKGTRRTFWESHHFAGTIDRAVDLQSFTSFDANDFSDRPTSGEGCVSGYDTTLDSVDLCDYTCALGFCPEPLSSCSETGELDVLPNESDRNISNIIASTESANSRASMTIVRKSSASTNHRKTNRHRKMNRFHLACVTILLIGASSTNIPSKEKKI